MNKTIVVFGGSFNPPNNAHFSLAEQIVNEYDEVEKILFIPVGDFYEKPGLLPGEIRVEMLRVVCAKNPHFDVSTVEVESQHLLNTIDTLEVIQAQYPNYEIWFTTGTDNLRQIPYWSKAEELLTRFRLLVLERDIDNMNDIVDDSYFLKKYKNNLIRVKETIRSNSSSTFLREKLRAGKSIRYLVPDEVFNYIKEKNLFNF